MAKKLNITPLHDRVIIKPAAAEEKTASGIYIPDTAKEKPQQGIYQCQECLTLYKPEYGDESQGIPKGILFENLPETYCCSLCEAPKSNFRILEAVEQ